MKDGFGGTMQANGGILAEKTGLMFPKLGQGREGLSEEGDGKATGRPPPMGRQREQGRKENAENERENGYCGMMRGQLEKRWRNMGKGAIMKWRMEKAIAK